LISIIGNEIFVKALVHYTGVNYQVEEPSPALALLDQLVQYMQLPISFLATLWHYQGNDISHEDSGRKMKIDATSEKMAWEWMYDRDDAAALRNYQRALDRLIKFLNDNVGSFPEWADSDARKETLSLFINTWEHFNRLFAIDNSPAFFLRLAPIMKEIERKHIKPILGLEKFTELKTLIKAGEELTAANQEWYDTVCDPIPLLTMAKAVKRFSVTVLPEGVVQQFFSQFQQAKANQPVTMDQVKYVSKDLYADGIEVINELKKYWSALNVDESDQSIDDLIPGGETTDKFMSL